MIKKGILFILLGFIFCVNLYAQCAMCKEAVENSVAENGQNYGGGLNTAILWLMVFPYLLFMGIVGLLLYNRKKKKEQELITK